MFGTAIRTHCVCASDGMCGLVFYVPQDGNVKLKM